MKTVLITGAGRGIGLAATKRFLSEGCRVIAVDQSVSGLSCLKEILAANSQYIEVVAGDLTKQDVIEQVVCAVSTNGSLNTLVLNHGVGANLDTDKKQSIVLRTALDFESDSFDLVMNINFKSHVKLVGALIGFMPKEDASAIITASSIWSKGVLHYALPYATSKSALSVATLNWARQFAPIRAVTVLLGGFETPMLTSNPNGPQEVANETLLKRAGTEDEAADAYWFIANNNYLTATEIYLDGGSTNR